MVSKLRASLNNPQIKKERQENDLSPELPNIEQHTKKMLETSKSDEHFWDEKDPEQKSSTKKRAEGATSQLSIDPSSCSARYKVELQ